MPQIHPLEAHLLSLLPPDWPLGRGHRLRAARMVCGEAETRAWLTPLHAAGTSETTLWHTGPPPRAGMGGVRWWAPGVPMVYLGTREAEGRTRHIYRLPVHAALEAAELGLIEYGTRA